eukprot:CAMPEP_0118943422 /NCGR_PEP_ID=MMETSP1169-20130426/38278_1 /TAXON_ID=36882 /ORGANISM="Pyramimonas obovata, Strain CCMP722" /LENGTH=127 /DNA_ID=CAMNT_0006888671 /DNA_START=180 /DNA_END=559 /DNA_ORIENTATION=+
MAFRSDPIFKPKESRRAKSGRSSRRQRWLVPILVTVLAPFAIQTFKGPAHQLALSSFLFQELFDEEELQRKASEWPQPETNVFKAPAYIPKYPKQEKPPAEAKERHVAEMARYAETLRQLTLLGDSS